MIKIKAKGVIKGARLNINGMEPMPGGGVLICK